MSDDVNVSSVPDNNVQVTQEASQTPPVATQEKMLRQSEVNDIVHARTRQAAEKAEQVGYQRAMAELKTQQETRQAPNTMGGMAQLAPEDIQKRIDEGVQQALTRNREDTEIANFTNRLMGKMIDGAKNYPDFDDVVSKLDLSKVPKLLVLADGVENTADILYDLAKNRHKLAYLDNLAHNHPRAAEDEVKNLSASIKANQAAAKETAPPAPIGQISPSPLSTGSGQMTISDWAAKYRGRG